MGRAPLDGICTQTEEFCLSCRGLIHDIITCSLIIIIIHIIPAKSPVWLDCGTEGRHLFEVPLLIALSRIYIWVVKAAFKKKKKIFQHPAL